MKEGEYKPCNQTNLLMTRDLEHTNKQCPKETNQPGHQLGTVQLVKKGDPSAGQQAHKWYTEVSHSEHDTEQKALAAENEERARKYGDVLSPTYPLPSSNPPPKQQLAATDKAKEQSIVRGITAEEAEAYEKASAARQMPEDRSEERGNVGIRFRSPETGELVESPFGQPSRQQAGREDDLDKAAAGAAEIKTSLRKKALYKASSDPDSERAKILHEAVGKYREKVIESNPALKELDSQRKMVNAASYIPIKPIATRLVEHESLIHRRMAQEVRRMAKSSEYDQRRRGHLHSLASTMEAEAKVVKRKSQRKKLENIKMLSLATHSLSHWSAPAKKYKSTYEKHARRIADDSGLYDLPPN